MAEKIGPQHGIEAARQREKQLHPAYAAAWDKRSDTFLKLVNGHNDHEDRLRAVEEAVRLGPFG